MHKSDALAVFVLALAMLWAQEAAAGSQQKPGKTLETAHKAFERFRQGLAKGEWDAFLDMLTDDFTFWFPSGKYHGLNTGKPRAAEFFPGVSRYFSQGLFITEVLRVTSNDSTVMFEFRDEAKLPEGKIYKNRVAISLDVCGEKICGYREYFGSDRESN